MKKRIWGLAALLLGSFFSVHAQDVSSLTWSQVCSGKMSSEWYGTEEAQSIADDVLYVQKTNGGWMKNDELHQLTAEQKQSLYNKRNEHSCFDNAATTQEMRFLAKVYQQTGIEKYKTAFMKALNLIFTAEKGCGGWSQYWPLSGNGSYQDYITFNDNLTTNVMRLLQDIIGNKGDFENLVDDETRARCEASFQKGLEVIIKCQVNDNGTMAAWCAQHDTTTFLPTEGRPHELPSISGSESASLLSFLMTIENPSKELQATITSAVEWLDAHKIEGKAIEEFTNDGGEKDRRVIDKSGSAIWGRFIQLGGETGEQTYDAFFTKLKNRNKSRSYTTGGKTYTYTEYEIATTSYRPEMAYQPIYAIYDDQYQHLYYRFLYNFEDTDPEVDSKGLAIPTSLNAIRRTSYQFLGSWCLNVINVEYPAWLQRIKDQEESAGYVTYALSSETYTGSTTSGSTTSYNFSGGISISNEKGKAYAPGLSSVKGIKYSAGVKYTITLPDGITVDKIKFYGYDNYAEADAYISNLNGVTYNSTEYVFPAKDENGNVTLTSHTFDFSEQPASGNIDFTVAGKQCGLAITLFCKDSASGVTDITTDNRSGLEKGKKILQDGQLLIHKDGNWYNLAGQIVGQDARPDK